MDWITVFWANHHSGISVLENIFLLVQLCWLLISPVLATPLLSVARPAMQLTAEEMLWVGADHFGLMLWGSGRLSSGSAHHSFYTALISSFMSNTNTFCPFAKSWQNHGAWRALTEQKDTGDIPFLNKVQPAQPKSLGKRNLFLNLLW